LLFNYTLKQLVGARTMLRCILFPDGPGDVNS